MCRGCGKSVRLYGRAVGSGRGTTSPTPARRWDLPRHFPRKSTSGHLHRRSRSSPVSRSPRSSGEPAPLGGPCLLPNAEPLPPRRGNAEPDALHWTPTAQQLVRTVVQLATPEGRASVPGPLPLCSRGDRPHLLELSRYTVQNPVRARLCASPIDWSWSSCRAMLGLARPTDFLAVGRVLGHFGPDLDRSRRGFHTFVHDAASNGQVP